MNRLKGAYLDEETRLVSDVNQRFAILLTPFAVACNVVDVFFGTGRVSTLNVADI
ncbi:MAG: hypothetical protein JWP08_3777 [Bryobacterales bacterium]|jgi:hypothetical protein|nr:hypothetical protein [Bryobacterales bacterium]